MISLTEALHQDTRAVHHAVCLGFRNTATSLTWSTKHTEVEDIGMLDFTFAAHLSLSVSELEEGSLLLLPLLLSLGTRIITDVVTMKRESGVLMALRCCFYNECHHCFGAVTIGSQLRTAHNYVNLIDSSFRHLSTYAFNNLYSNPSTRKSVSIIFIPSITFSSSSRWPTT